MMEMMTGERQEHKMVNQEVREAAKAKNIQLWAVAEVLGISEASMTRKMRRELPEEEKQRILSLIDTLEAM